MAVTPMLSQYFQIKEQYPDALLFFRLGDFYEMFGDDAKQASRLLDITLTSRDAGKDRERLPMCGVPHHAVSGYLQTLVEKGYNVAICEQLEDPKQAKGVVKRDVVRVVTPGTYLEASGDSADKRYLAAAVKGPQDIGLALVELSTGEFKVTVIDTVDALNDELQRVVPVELLVNQEMQAQDHAMELVQSLQIPTAEADRRMLRRTSAEKLLLDHFEIHTLDAFGLHKRTAVQAAAAALQYILNTQKNTAEHIRNIRAYRTDQYLTIDGASLRNLEVFQSLGDSKGHSLFGIINQTITSMGARMLRTWMQQPLLQIDLIVERQDAVDALVTNPSLRDDLRQALDGILDLERLLSRLISGSGTPRDLRALSQSMQNTNGLRAMLNDAEAKKLAELQQQIQTMPEFVRTIDQALVDDPPLVIRDGGIIRDGFHDELDELREASRGGRQWIQSLEEQERSHTGIKSLKVGYNKVFGYYLEVTKPNIHLVPETYMRKQTLSNAERFITPELKEKESLILGADERIKQLEYQLFVDLRDRVREHVDAIQATAAAIAELDSVQSLAETAARQRYCRPEIREEPHFDVREGRHPVIESVQPAFVPNDLFLDSKEKTLLLTGPNMAGKSTYLRQNALIVLLAQMGSFVPAERAHIGLVDRIFTRIGAGDDLSTGQSTFMVECAETAHLLHHATQRSLIILDELGRGTSTFDGMAIAQAVIEHIHDSLGARTLFSTHYHELTKLQETLQGLAAYRVEVEESRGQVFFLHKVVRGNADRSYGINVAKMAGIPKGIIRRSQDLLYQLEAGQKKPVQLDLFQSAQYSSGSQPSESDEEILDELQSLDPEQMTPRQALDILFRWKQIMEGG